MKSYYYIFVLVIIAIVLILVCWYYNCISILADYTGIIGFIMTVITVANVLILRNQITELHNKHLLDKRIYDYRKFYKNMREYFARCCSQDGDRESDHEQFVKQIMECIEISKDILRKSSPGQFVSIESLLKTCKKTIHIAKESSSRLLQENDLNEIYENLVEAETALKNFVANQKASLK